MENLHSRQSFWCDVIALKPVLLISDHCMNVVIPQDNTGKAKSAHTFLPFYNEPYIVDGAKKIYAARMGPYKAHWVTSPGLGNDVDMVELSYVCYRTCG